LAAISSRRGGAECVLRRRWPSRPTDLADEIEGAVTRFAAPDFPHGLPYEVRTLLARLPTPPRPVDPDEEPLRYPAETGPWRDLLVGEIERCVIQKRIGGAHATSTATEIRTALSGLGLDLAGLDSYRGARSRVGTWVEEALVVRHLAMASRAVTNASRGGPA
jgi:hypothetical protein